MECQSYRLTVEDAPSIKYVARHIAQIQQKYTQRGGRRPFGISTFVAGVDVNGPQLYHATPFATYHSYKADATGRSSDTLREFLEKNHKDDLSESDAVQLGVKALLQIVDNGAKNMEVCVMRKGGVRAFIETEALEEIVKAIEAEKPKEGAEEKKADA
jgi:20S proteasome subunit alpha 4